MKNVTVYNEAALSEGSERFYRGAKAGEATPAKDLVFSRDRADAAAYAAKIGGELSYVDVPKGRVAELKSAAHKPEARVIVSAEMAQGRRVAETSQMMSAAPQQRRPTGRAITGPAEYRETPRVENSERFYHGGKPDELPSAKGMVFFRDIADAGRYAFKTGGQLSYIDVAKERMAEVRPSSKALVTRVVVSPDLARERQAVPIVETNTLKAAPIEAAPAQAGERQAAAAEPAAAALESAPGSDASSKSARTSKPPDPIESADKAQSKKSAAEEAKTPARSTRMSALRERQRAAERQPRSQESGQEM